MELSRETVNGIVFGIGWVIAIASLLFMFIHGINLHGRYRNAATYSILKTYIVGTIILMLFSFQEPFLNEIFKIMYDMNLEAYESEEIGQERRLNELEYMGLVSRLALALHGLYFSFLLVYQRRIIEKENEKIRVQFTQQLKHELDDRSFQLREQEKRLDEQRFNQLRQDFEQKQTETEMVALRAQMNPHFIFNCLNSIKFYVIKNEPAKASEYLNKFAQLIRLVLENSHSNMVTLDKELEALQLYIEMEALRFEDKLEFRIEVDPSIDTDFIEIPPLLIQPYVENAIWHGLMHKDCGGTLQVQVVQPQENQLKISIRDNGVGRKKAAELKSKSATKNKSFGMKMTSTRIDLINQLYGTQTVVKIYDLTDENGEPAGTEIILQIPLS